MQPITKDTFTCPQCGEDGSLQVWNSLNVDLQPEVRQKVEDLSMFEWICPNCGKTSLVLHPCLYHDMSNEFMVWFAPDNEVQNGANFAQLDRYTLRTTHTPNEFREKINLLERGLDDRAMELVKLILLMQLERDGMDIVDLVFHDLGKDGQFEFVLVHPDGVEQYVQLPSQMYQKLARDVRHYIQTPQRSFETIDLNWAQEALKFLRDTF